MIFVQFFRWLVHSSNWGVVSTISTRSLPSSSSNKTDSTTHQSIPFGNIFSLSDGLCDPSSSTGLPYLYATDLDQTMQDVHENPMISLTISEASFAQNSKACSTTGYFGDPENPPCARLVLTGTFRKIASDQEMEFGREALLSKHPSMKYWPLDHEFFVGTLEIEDLWMLDWFGGASILNVDDYFNIDLTLLEKEEEKLEFSFLQDIASFVRFGF